MIFSSQYTMYIRIVSVNSTFLCENDYLYIMGFSCWFSCNSPLYCFRMRELIMFSQTTDSKVNLHGRFINSTLYLRILPPYSEIYHMHHRCYTLAEDMRIKIDPSVQCPMHPQITFTPIQRKETKGNSPEEAEESPVGIFVSAMYYW